MIRRFLMDSDAKMSKTAYYEMCEMLGNEPLEDEVPLDLSDFPPLVQQCFLLYEILPDNWDTMGGNYMGKDYTIIFSLFKLHELDSAEQLLCFSFLQHMDGVRTKLVSEKLKQKQKSPST